MKELKNIKTRAKSAGIGHLTIITISGVILFAAESVWGFLGIALMLSWIIYTADEKGD